MENLPEEVVEMIGESLSPRDLARCTAVCRSWRNIFNTDRLWKNLCDIELEEPLRKIPCVVAPNFVVPEAENSSLSPVCHWKLVFMRENHLWKNWRMHDSLFYDTLEAEDSNYLPAGSNVQKFTCSNILGAEFLTDTVILVWHKFRIEIVDISVNLTVCATSNEYLSISVQDDCCVKGTSRFLVEKAYSADIYRFDLTSKSIVLELSVHFDKVDRFFCMPNPIVDNCSKAVNSCSEKHFYLFLKPIRSVLQIFDLESNEMVKEEPLPVAEGRNSYKFVQMWCSSAGNFVVVPAKLVNDDDVVLEWRYFFFDMEQLTFVSGVRINFSERPESSAVLLQADWFAYSDSDRTTLTVVNLRTREVLRPHSTDYGYEFYDMQVWDDSFLFTVKCLLTEELLIKCYSPSHRLMTILLENPSGPRTRVYNKALLIRFAHKNNLKVLLCKKSGRKMKKLYVNEGLIFRKWCKTNNSLTKMLFWTMSSLYIRNFW